jgi:hypothetical protein
MDETKQAGERGYGWSVTNSDIIGKYGSHPTTSILLLFSSTLNKNFVSQVLL